MKYNMSDECSLLCQEALRLVKMVDDIELKLRHAQQGLQIISWSTYSIAHTTGSKPAPQRLTEEQMASYRNQLIELEKDMKYVAKCMDRILPYCTGGT